MKLRDDGQYDATCPVCKDQVIVRRVSGTLGNGDLKTTAPENHSPSCMYKDVVKKRPVWQNTHANS
jgi:hypothetical protein